MKKSKCEICSNKIIEIFKLKNFPRYTINSFEKKNLLKNKLTQLKLYFCLKCKNISLKKKIPYRNFYKNHKAKSINVINNTHSILKKINDNIKINKNDKVLEISKNCIFSDKIVKKKNIIFKKINLYNFSKEINNKSLNNIRLIICYDFLGNIINLKKFFKKISKILSNDGIVMCQHHYGPSLIKNLTLDRVYLEHKNYLSIKALNYLAKMNNLNINKLDFFENKNFFTIIISRRQNKKNKKRIEKIIQSENKINIKSINKFNKKINKVLNKISQILENKVYSKYNLIGFGSSIGSLPLIIYFKLEKKINFLIDDYPLKKFFPLSKSQINIRKFSKFRFKKKSIIISLAPRYLELFKRNVVKKLNKENIFISLLPKFKIIKKT